MAVPVLPTVINMTVVPVALIGAALFELTTGTVGIKL
jgi:hypothetical protein